MDRLQSNPTKRQLCDSLGLDFTEYNVMPYLSLKPQRVIIADVSENLAIFKSLSDEKGYFFEGEEGGKGEIYREETREETASRVKEQYKAIKKTLDEEREKKFKQSIISFGVNQYCLA